MSYKNYTLESILYIIRNKESLMSEAEMGSIDLIGMILDAEDILVKANLTKRQLEIFTLYYRADHTLATVGEQLGITHQAVADAINQSKKKIQRVLEEDM